jgi:pyruvate/2-oxoglutarate dehydrogenase complex dihydrolipoamide dehydrogenase (E3) component
VIADVNHPTILEPGVPHPAVGPATERWNNSAVTENSSPPIAPHRVVVIGGGPGGYDAALAAAQLGATTVLIERAGVGGSAVLTDVVPSKTLIATADAAVAVGESAELGVEFVDADSGAHVTPAMSVNLEVVNRRLLALAQSTSRDMKETLEEAGVTVIEAEGRLDGPHRVVARSVGENSHDIDSFDADTVIVAVGARPRTLPTAEPDGVRILTWTQLYNLTEVPEHLIVIGSGVTGAEFASAYRNLGARVTLVSSRDRVLPGEDGDAAQVLEDVFVRRGMSLRSRARAESVVATDAGIVVTLADGSTIEGSHCLIAVGSIPNTANLGLDSAGVVLADSGHIRVNKVARTSMSNIYAVGDCSDALPLASVASHQGRTAVFHALGEFAKPLDTRLVCSNIFTSPEIATVGYSESDVTSGAVNGVVYKLDLDANPRAKMQGTTDGFIKLIAQPESGILLGGVIVAPRASELINLLSFAMEHRHTVDQLARSWNVYPSLAGGIADTAKGMHPLRK